MIQCEACRRNRKSTARLEMLGGWYPWVCSQCLNVMLQKITKELAARKGEPNAQAKD